MGLPRVFRGLMRWGSYVADAARYVGRNRSCTASVGVSRGARPDKISGAVEPRYRTLAVALVPQPQQMPPPAFDKGELQRIFADVIRHYPYEAFGFTQPNQRGAQFNNGPDDVVEFRPAAFQIQTKMDGPDLLTGPMASDKVAKIFKIAAERLKVAAFLQCHIQIIASVDAPDEDAKQFVAERLLHDIEQSDELGPDYFAGGVRFRRLVPPPPGEDSLSVEPDVNDNSLLYIDFQMARLAATGPIALDQASSWIGEAFDFVGGPTMRLLSR